jgi:hypothetical protein
MNSDPNKTDIRRQRNADYDDIEETKINNEIGGGPKYGTHVDSKDFNDEEPTDENGNVRSCISDSL